jgi:hypothetical protein
MTNQEIHNIYLHMSGKAEGIAEATGSADFPVLFANAILDFERMNRKWIGMTAKERTELWSETDMSGMPEHDYGKKIESKLRMKNGY